MVSGESGPKVAGGTAATSEYAEINFAVSATSAASSSSVDGADSEVVIDSTLYYLAKWPLRSPPTMGMCRG